VGREDGGGVSLLGRVGRLIASPWAPVVRGVLDKLPELRPPLPAPGPIAKVTHASRGSAPRWVRRHAVQINGDQSRRRNRKARARFGRIVAAKGAAA
jgi:hypothetical protein